MDKIDTPTTSWKQRRECHCGCDSFRFKFEPKDDTYTNICRNCNHTLAEHIHLYGFEQ